MMYAEILAELKFIESTHEIDIFFACEAGLHAWGFPCQDTCHQVRFLYKHPTSWYLSLSAKDDVITSSSSDSLDIKGWDLKKALNQLRLMDTSLLEWINSPVIYRKILEDFQWIQGLQGLSFSTSVLQEHYYGLAKVSWERVESKDALPLKHLLSSMRYILAAKWITTRQTHPPVKFQTLFSETVEDPLIISIVEDLLLQNIDSFESQDTYIPHDLRRFCKFELEQLNFRANTEHELPDIIEFEEVFQKILDG